MIPPIETKAPRVRERHVTQGTLLSSKEELRRFSLSKLLLGMLLLFGMVFGLSAVFVERLVRGGEFVSFSLLKGFMDFIFSVVMLGGW